MNRYVAAIALLPFSTTAAAQSENDVAAFMDARWEAWDNRDADALAAFLAEDAIAVNVVGDQHIGRKAIRDWYQMLFQRLYPKGLGPRHCQEATVQMVEDDVAIVTEECTFYSVMPHEQAAKRRLPIRHSRVTHVLADRGKGWEIIAFRNIPIWNPFAWEGTNH